jgi:hypothetical protein
MMATQESTSGADKHRLCMVKDGGGTVACWREATERLGSEWRESAICAEHVRAFALRREANELLSTLEQIGEWRLNSPACAPASGEDTRLEAHALEILNKALEDYWRAAVKAFAADLIAIQGAEEEPLTQEQAERLAAPWLLSDALGDTQAVLEDLKGVPEEAFGVRGRWAMVAAIAAASSKASAEHDRVGGEMGRK